MKSRANRDNVLDFQDEKLAAKKPKEDYRGDDLALWQQWDQNGRRQEDLNPLFSQFRGMIRSKANAWIGKAEIPPAAVQASFNAQFMNAINTFDPDKGRLGPWVGNHLKQGNRWLMKHQNIARIPESRSGKKIQMFTASRAHLDEVLGREPTHIEIAENLGWSPKEVSLLDREIRTSAIGSGFEMDPVDVMPSREKEALNNVYYELAEEEKLVYDYVLGAHGKPELKPTQIAQQLGYSPSKVSKLKNKIMDKLKKHL